ncbi:MAG: thioredoxin [Myxococcales bacterium]|nr:thioredoxin [Myxococcales bacterium]
MAGKNVREVNDLNFDAEVLQSDLPVLVDFTATWCGPCKQMAPFIDELADEYEGRVKVVKLDVGDSPATASAQSIRNVPTLFVYKGGEIVAQQVGAIPKARIAALIDRAL